MTCEGRLWEAEPSMGGCSQFLGATRGAGTRAFCMSLVAPQGRPGFRGGLPPTVPPCVEQTSLASGLLITPPAVCHLL